LQKPKQNKKREPMEFIEVLERNKDKSRNTHPNTGFFHIKLKDLNFNLI
jgi:hypothetical protein